MKLRPAGCVAIGIILSLSSCTVGNDVKPDPATGYISSTAGTSKATVVLYKTVDTSKYQPLALVTAGTFAEKQIRDLGFFKEVINLEQLQTAIVTNNLGDKVPSVNDRIGISNAAHHYKVFLWIHSKADRRGSKVYSQLIATDPMTMEDLFITEHVLDYVWAGVNDQNTFYPMFNSFIDWIHQRK